MRVEAALGDRLGAGRDRHAALEQAADERVGPEGLELALGVEVAVLPVEAHDQADRDRLLAHRVQEAAAEDAGRVRVAQGVHHPVGAERAGLGELDDGLHAQRVDLRVRAAAEALGELARDHAVGAVREDRDGRADLLRGQVVALGAAVVGEADLGEADALHGAVLDDQGARRVAVVDLDAGRLGLVGEERGQARDRDDVVADVVHPRRDHLRRDPVRGLRAQEVHVVPLDRDQARDERRPQVPPARDEVVQAGGLEGGARERVVAGGRGLVDDGDGDLAARGRRALPRPEPRGEPGRAGADDEDVDAVHA